MRQSAVGRKEETLQEDLVFLPAHRRHINIDINTTINMNIPRRSVSIILLRDEHDEQYLKEAIKPTLF